MQMENLITQPNSTLDTYNFVRIGDLCAFEGPILSLFEELNSGYLYLFDWVDRDKKHNRWLIYRVSPRELLKFLHEEISHFELFKSKPQPITYYIDIDSRNQIFYNYPAIELAEMPTNYYPNKDSFFEIEDCPMFEKIKSFVIKTLSNQKMENEYSIGSFEDFSWKVRKWSSSNKIVSKNQEISILITKFSKIPVNSLFYNNYNDKQSTSFYKKNKSYANQYN